MSSRITSGRNASACSTACRPSCAVRRSLPMISSNMRQAVGGVLVVVDDQDAATRRRELARSSAASRLRSGAERTHRQPHDELAAPAVAVAARLDVPPCSSTRRLTSVRPMPRPPCDRSSDRSTWVNMSKMRGSMSAGMPTPRVLDAARPPRRPSPRRSARSACRARVYLAALLSRLANTWASRVTSASRRPARPAALIVSS